MNVQLPYKWQPREYQLALWKALSGGAKRAAVCWHRRSGKDETMLQHNACAAFEAVGNYWYLLPQYNQCRKAIWDAVNPHTGKRRIDEVFPRAIRSKTLNQEMKIEFINGSTWQVIGSDNFDALLGAPPRGLTFSEYALSDPSAWGFLRPILLENKGWAVFNSTPRGKNHFYQIMRLAQTSDDWFSQTLTVDQTKIFSPEELQNELRELQLEHGDAYGKAIWLQEYYCSFEAALPGSIWGEQLTRITVNGRIQEIPIEKEIPVFTAWDLGRDDDTAVWFYQVIGNELHIIDYYEGNFKEIPELAQMLRDKKYDYGVHWLPHDAKPKRLGMGGKSILQQFLLEDVGQFAIVPFLDVEEGIQAGRATLARCYFDIGTETGIEHLRNYRRELDEKKGVFSAPVHDKHSHAADAFRYLSLSWRESAQVSPLMSTTEQLFKGNIVGMNFGALKKAHFLKMRNQRDQ